MSLWPDLLLIGLAPRRPHLLFRKCVHASIGPIKCSKYFSPRISRLAKIHHFFLQITDASRTKVGDTVVFTGPPKTEQKLWPAHCIQESWGSEFHKDLIVSSNFQDVCKKLRKTMYALPFRSIHKAKSSTKVSIPILTPIRLFSTTKNWAKQKWMTFWKRPELLIATFVVLPRTFVLVRIAELVVVE